MIENDASGVQCNDDEEEDGQCRNGEEVADALSIVGWAVQVSVLMLATEVGVLCELLGLSSGESEVSAQRGMGTGEVVDQSGREVK